ncbi:beta-N-acetylglucosaminidase domain-containing protein [Oceanobacillus longus]|uniref:Beta-N-acetylglucosaminidase domain-containing protein n=1 Tax=Oceanobacillus longus TaxID=930120 RepID=A0ABV8GYY8_9BACI
MKDIPKHRFTFVSVLFLTWLVLSSVGINSKVLAEEDNSNITVYPNPQSMETRGGEFPLTPKVGIVLPAEYDQTVLNELERTLTSFNVKNIQIFLPSDHPTTPVTIYLTNNPEDTSIISQLNSLDVELESALPNEGYILASGHANGGKKKIIIAGSDWEGAYYGVKTLKQIINSHTGRAKVPEIVIKDYPEMPIRGVIEGFYGIPWSQEERIDQIKFYADNKMNTYVYAPKDDPYHRDEWREPYPIEKLNQLGELVQTAEDNHVNFVFTISPGLDICYADNSDFDLLLDKADELWDLGVRDFAILLDDIFLEMNCEIDEDMFGDEPSPSASAQAYLLNKFQEEFIETHEGANRLITVPTEYYQEGTSVYREQFAELVDPSVLVYWTGIGITTDTITNEDAERISNIFQHDLLIWDNHPVNDFSSHRLFLGPLTGRDADLTEHGVNGLTANPMEHAEASKIPLFTIADYTWNPDDYDAQKSWEASIDNFAGPFVEEVTTFAENALSSHLSQDESPTLTLLIELFWRSYEQANVGEDGNDLLNEFINLENTADELQNNYSNKEFVEEMNPWIDKMRHFGKAGQLAVQMLLAQQEGDKELTAQYRSQLDNVLANDTTDVEYEENQSASRHLDGVNQARGWAELVMYTPEHGKTTGTNEWGYEITVIDGKVTSVDGNNSVIPENGYVLSVHSGGDGDWLENNSIVGANVSVEDNTVMIIIEKGLYQIPNIKSYAHNVIEPFINQALTENDTWLGGRAEAGPFSTIGEYSSYSLDHIVDGNMETLYWTLGSPKEGDYVGVDLGELKTISKIQVYMASTSGVVPRPSDYIKHGAIEISNDGSNWKVLGEFRDQAEISIDLNDEEARFVRFKVLTDQSSWAQIREFVVEY